MLGNWTSHLQRDQTRVISSVINSGPQLTVPWFTSEQFQFPEALLTTLDSQERAGGGGALRAGFHPWRVALDH